MRGGGRVGVGDDHLGPGPQVLDVQLAKDVGMGDGGETAPGVGAHGHAQALQLGAGRPVQDDWTRVGESLGEVLHGCVLPGKGAAGGTGRKSKAHASPETSAADSPGNSQFGARRECRRRNMHDIAMTALPVSLM